MESGRTLFCSAALALAATGANADLNIAKKPTQNMNCSGGVCTATAKNAILNVTDLTAMLASGDLTVKTGGGAVAIQVNDGFSWTSAHRLTLDAIELVSVHEPVVVAGTSGLTITTNDGGTGGDLYFFGKGQVTFWDVASSLVINGQSYTLLTDLPSLASAMYENKNGSFALANDYDAEQDKFKGPPIPYFKGRFDGLGHTLLHLKVRGGSRASTGMFAASRATIRDIYLKEVDVHSGRKPLIGALVGWNFGRIVNASSDGQVSGAYDSEVGGLVGRNDGQISRSRSTAVVTTSNLAGGLVGLNNGSINESFANGAVTAVWSGGLVGIHQSGSISDSYATGSVSGGQFGGGFVGEIVEDIDDLSSSYSVGTVEGDCIGGFAGYDYDTRRSKDSYWDMDTSGITDPSQGACNVQNPSGITGLTDAQLKSALPDGFDPKIWGQNPNINNGYPYLLANPPQ